MKDTAIERLKNIRKLIEAYGYIDGAHHKQWLLDQIMREIMGTQYDQWKYEYEHVNDEKEYTWNQGIRP